MITPVNCHPASSASATPEVAQGNSLGGRSSLPAEGFYSPHTIEIADLRSAQSLADIEAFKGPLECTTQTETFTP